MREYFLASMREIARNQDIDTHTMLTQTGDLEPFDLRDVHHRISQHKFLALVRREQHMLHPGCDIFDFVLRKQSYPIVRKVFDNFMPNVDGFGALGEPKVKKVLQAPYDSDWGP